MIVHVFDPLIKSSNLVTDQLQINTYTHTMEAFGGFWSADMEFAADTYMMDDWLLNGLGRHIVVYGSEGVVAWEGFVDSISCFYGPLSVTRGPLLDVANRVMVHYLFSMPNWIPPVYGQPRFTDEANDTTSQGLYGIISKCVSIGEANEFQNIPNFIRDAYISEHAWPKTTKKWQTQEGTAPKVQLSCKGYAQFMTWWYNNEAGWGQDADAKILAVIADNPNIAWLPFNVQNIDSNTTQVIQFEDYNNTALNIIRDVVAIGDSTADKNRWIFGVYEDLRAHYHQAPEDMRYETKITESGQQVNELGGSWVPPWAVRPAEWMFFPDFLPGQTFPVRFLGPFQPKRDPRALFIENLTFTAPWNLVVQGGDLNKLPQLMAQFGLGGISG